MPDWAALLRQRLATVRVPRERLEEIIAEMAAHLESAFRDGTAKAAAPSAEEFADAQLGDIAELRANIERVEGGSMGERFRCFWMPAFLGVCMTQLVSWAVSITATLSVLSGHLMGTRSALYYALVGPALMLLVGAFVATLARRTGATRGCAFAAGIAPAILLMVPPAVSYAFASWARGGAFDSSFLARNGVTLIAMIAGPLLFSIAIPRVRQQHPVQ